MLAVLSDIHANLEALQVELDERWWTGSLILGELKHPPCPSQQRKESHFPTLG